jgi:hypothetical protein
LILTELELKIHQAPGIGERWDRHFLSAAAWCSQNHIPADRLVRSALDPMATFRSGTPFPTLLSCERVREFALQPHGLVAFQRNIACQLEILRLARAASDQSDIDLKEVLRRPAVFHPVLRYNVVRGRDVRLETTSRRMP